MARDEAGEGLRGRLWVSGLLSPASVSDHRTLGVTRLTEERLTIQIHKQEGTRTVATGKIIKGHIK